MGKQENKVIVRISHDRHREDIISVRPYSPLHEQEVRMEMEKQWKDGSWDYFGDLPADDGEQFGLDEFYYDSYCIVPIKA